MFFCVKREVLLKPETFKVIDAYIPVATWTYILAGIIALVIVFLLFSVFMLDKKNRRTIAYINMRYILVFLGILSAFLLFISAISNGNPFNTDRYKYVVAEVDTKLKKLLTCKLNNDIIYMQKRTRSNIPVPQQS